MTEFEKSMLNNMINNGLNIGELSQFLVNNTNMESTQSSGTQTATQLQTSTASSGHTSEDEKGGENNVDIKQLLAMIEKQNETIAAIQAENLRQIQMQKPPETMEDILMSEFIEPLLVKEKRV